jgi:hypothetical protein
MNGCFIHILDIYYPWNIKFFIHLEKQIISNAIHDFS